jgi:hypothetical protein
MRRMGDCFYVDFSTVSLDRFRALDTVAIAEDGEKEAA